MITLSSLQALPAQSLPAPPRWKPLALEQGLLPSRVAQFLRWRSSSKNQECQIKRPRFEISRRVKLQHGMMELTFQATERKVRWLLEPAGDGDSNHLAGEAPLPAAFELSSDRVVVGRLSRSSNIVIPVATVSAHHARLEKKDGSLFVTDLGSTNGTYIDRKKLKPGAATQVLPGSRIVFGDEHLAAFRLSKVPYPVEAA